jgi:hypothetical protein
MSMRETGSVAVAILAAAALLAGAACKSKSAQESIIENRLERALEKASGGKVDIDLKGGTLKVKTEEGENVLTTGERKWPEDLPEGMIKFENAMVLAVSRAANEEGKTWTVHVAGAGEDALDRYAEKLRADGWTIEASMTRGAEGTVTATKDDLSVHVVTAAGGKTCVITYVQRTDR